ncbi:MAG TPA: hypothetical protein VED17_02830 [Nitrososphaerales archaeon]|nr:hypothetical protein [Nitrososphaerales archaeon]
MRGIITLCGSTRFKEEFEEVNRTLELNDWVVLTVASYYHSENDRSLRRWIERNKRQLDRLHLVKIELSQAIVVIDVGGYIGKSTRSEIRHAKELEKPIYYYSDKSWRALTRE